MTLPQPKNGGNPLDEAAGDQLNITGQRPHWLFWTAMIFLSLTTLACGLIGTEFQSNSGRIVSVTRLPTLTRTPLPTLSPTPDPTAIALANVADGELATPASSTGDSSIEASGSNQVVPSEIKAGLEQEVVGESDGSPEAVSPRSEDDQPANNNNEAVPAEAPLPTATTSATPLAAIPPTATATDLPPPTAMPTPTPLPAGWVFSGVRAAPEQKGGSPLVYGDVINNTGSPQELYLITANFYDQQGQLLPNVFTADYRPIETVPQGGRVPFELTVIGLDTVGNFDLSVDASPSEQDPHQEFKFSEVNQTVEEDRYCLSGRLQNLGSGLKVYLSITSVLYDQQNNVISFSDQYIHSPDNLVGEQMSDFKVCADPFGQEVVSHELRAWGL